MQKFRIWDPVLRSIHWGVAGLFLANAVFTSEGSAAHLWVGYLLAILVALRMAWGVVGPVTARFASFTPSVRGAVTHLTDIATQRPHAHKGHSPLGALMVYNLLVTLALISVTGWAMTTDMFWGLAWPEDLHEGLVVWAEISVILHIGAVLFESGRTGVNLPKSMITGYKAFPNRQDPT